MADAVNDQVQGDDLETATAAIEALLKQAPQEETETQPNSPQAAATEQSAEGNTAQEGATEASDAGNATEIPPVVATAPITQPAKPATSSPELETARQEAAKKAQEAETARNQYVTKLSTLVPAMEAAVKGEFADIKTVDDLERLASTDVPRYNRYVFAQMRLQQAQQARNEAVQESQRVENERLAEWRKGEEAKISEMLPDLKDPVKGPVLARKLQDYATKAGYTAQQLQNASANDYRIIHEAMSYQEMKAQQEASLAQAKAKAAVAPPVQKPGVAKTTTSKEQKAETDFERLTKTGRVEDAAAVFRHFIN